MFDGSLENPIAAAMLLLAFVALAPLLLMALLRRPRGEPSSIHVAGWAALLLVWVSAPFAVFNHLRPETLLWMFGPEVGDGGLVEYATVAAWAAAAAFASSLAVRSTGWERLIFSLAAVAATVLFGEEISWGQWIFNWTSPDYFAETNLQGETNAHNFMPPYVFDAAYATVGLLIALLGGLVRFWRGGPGWMGALRSSAVARWVNESALGVPLAFTAAIFLQHHMFQEVAELGLSLAVAYALGWTFAVGSSARADNARRLRPATG